MSFDIGTLKLTLIREDFIMNKIKGWIGELTDIAVALVILGVAAGVVFGMDVPFVGAVLGNLIDLINTLGDKNVVKVSMFLLFSQECTAHAVCK